MPWLRMFGFKSPEEMVGVDAIQGHILPEDMEWVLQEFARVMADPEMHDVATLRAKTGRPHNLGHRFNDIDHL